MIAAAGQPDDRKPNDGQPDDRTPEQKKEEEKQRRKGRRPADDRDLPPDNVIVESAASLPTLNEGRIRSNAKLLAKLTAAGEIAADRLPALLDQIQKLVTGKKRLSARDLAAVGKLQLAIATAAVSEQKPQQHLHLHGDSNCGPDGTILHPPQAVDDAEYIEFIAARNSPDHLQPGGDGSLGHGWKMGALSAPATSESPADRPGGRPAAG